MSARAAVSAGEEILLLCTYAHVLTACVLCAVCCVVQLEEALQECPANSGSPGAQHLRAQLLYRMGRYDECSGIYGRLMDEGAVSERLALLALPAVS